LQAGVLYEQIGAVVPAAPTSSGSSIPLFGVSPQSPKGLGEPVSRHRHGEDLAAVRKSG